MKKVIIEQIGNVIMVGLATYMLMFMVAHSFWRDNGDSLFKFGIAGILLVGWLILFGLIRLFLIKTDHSFKSSKGELSTADEREKEISAKSIAGTYKVIFTLLLIDLFGTAIVSVIIGNQVVLFRQITIATFGITIMIGFLTYLVTWIYFDVTH